MLKLNKDKYDISEIPRIDYYKEIQLKEEISKDLYSFVVHNFLENLRKNKICENKKISVSKFINNLSNCTEKQKQRFLIYYNLIPNNKRILNYNDIGKIENRTSSSIKTSIVSISSKLVNLKDEEKKFF